LAQRFSEELDRRISDSDFQIIGRQFHRLLAYRGGRLLVQVRRDPEDKAELLINFERRSKEAEQLRQWLSLPIQDIRDTVRLVLTSVLQLREEDYVIERNEHADEQQPEPAAREN
jgi:hypothetical protein